MKSLNFAIITVGAVAVVLNSMATATADPAPAINYSVDRAGDSAVLTTDSGTLQIADGKLDVVDNAGRIVVGLPLTYTRDDKTWPIAARIDGNRATLTPNTDPAAAVPAPGTSAQLLHPTALDPQSSGFNTALSNFSTILSIGTALGTIIGTIVGASLGCLIGGVVAGLAGTVVSFGVLSIPGFLGGCIVTGVAGAAAGAIVGTIVFGGASLLIGGILLAGALGAQAGTP
ncbi:hypothetical protein [Nocardia arthritidis]|uniref:DUF8020 domain-containing protein n=1 Tax=Nocardia arthritidis TaxID=228602 RepID=A0A6G9Y548_9NOCA|nr:hypothetical protein [Nocardia arthritidis]QIS08196.1 hypothetical protein F5544_01360 [Nocardia arthritidis]